MLWGLPKGLLGGMLEFWISLYKSYAKHFSKLCLSVAWSLLTRCSFAWSSEHYRAQKAVFFTYEVKEFKQFADNMIRSTVNEIKWTSLLARSLNLIAYISSSFPAHCSLGDWQVVLDKYFTSSSSHIVSLSGGECISLVDWFKSKEKKETEKEKKVYYVTSKSRIGRSVRLVIVKKSMTTNVSVILLLLDLSAAFETVDNNILLDLVTEVWYCWTYFGMVRMLSFWLSTDGTYKWLSVITKKPLMQCAPREVKSVFVISRHGWPLIN